jgi:head-tail adaptor
MSDALGAMRHRVIVQKPTRIADEIGGAALSWIDDGACWAEIGATGASEAPAFDAARAINSFRVSINRRDIAAGWRLAWGERRLRVIGVRDDGGARLSLSCQEERL